MEDLELLGCTGASASAVNPVIRFNDVRNALLHGCRSPETACAFLRVEGKGTERIKLIANDLTEAKKAVDLGSGVRADAVRMGKAD